MSTSAEPMQITGPTPRTLPPTLQSFQRWTLIFFTLSVLFHVVEYFLHSDGFRVYPLSVGTDRFYDFTIFYDKFRDFGTARFFEVGFPINYPAPAILGFEFFFRYMRPHALLAFVIFSVLCFVVPAAMFAKALVRRGVPGPRAALFCIVITLCSWPVVLLIDRGNIEVLVWLTLLIGMWAYATGREWLASVFFGIGASLKLFPFVLFGLFLSRRQWKHVLLGAAVFLAVSLLSLAIVGPTIAAAYRGIRVGMQNFQLVYMGMWHPAENGVDHSLFALYKWIAFTFFHHGRFFTQSLTVFLALSVTGGLALYVFHIRFLPLLNQVLILTIASIYFTPFSGDGTLVHLYYPTAMLLLLGVRADRDRVVIPGLRFVLGCLVFILSFESFLIHHERFIGPVKGMAIGLLLLAALRYPFGPPLAETRSETILSEPETAWAVPRHGRATELSFRA